MIREFIFSKARLDKVPVPNHKQNTYSDKRVPGLKFCIYSTGLKLFLLRCTINKKEWKIKLGNYPDMSIDDARKKVIYFKNKIQNGEYQKQTHTKIPFSFEEFYQEFKVNIDKLNDRINMLEDFADSLLQEHLSLTKQVNEVFKLMQMYLIAEAKKKDN